MSYPTNGQGPTQFDAHAKYPLPNGYWEPVNLELGKITALANAIKNLTDHSPALGTLMAENPVVYKAVTDYIIKGLEADGAPSVPEQREATLSTDTQSKEDTADLSLAEAVSKNESAATSNGEPERAKEVSVQQKPEKALAEKHKSKLTREKQTYGKSIDKKLEGWLPSQITALKENSSTPSELLKEVEFLANELQKGLILKDQAHDTLKIIEEMVKRSQDKGKSAMDSKTTIAPPAEPTNDTQALKAETAQEAEVISQAAVSTKADTTAEYKALLGLSKDVELYGANRRPRGQMLFIKDLEQAIENASGSKRSTLEKLLDAINRRNDKNQLIILSNEALKAAEEKFASLKKMPTSEPDNDSSAIPETQEQIIEKVVKTDNQPQQHPHDNAQSSIPNEINETRKPASTKSEKPALTASFKESDVVKKELGFLKTQEEKAVKLILSKLRFTSIIQIEDEYQFAESQGIKHQAYKNIVNAITDQLKAIEGQNDNDKAFNLLKNNEDKISKEVHKIELSKYARDTTKALRNAVEKEKCAPESVQSIFDAAEKVALYCNTWENIAGAISPEALDKYIAAFNAAVEELKHARAQYSAANQEGTPPIAKVPELESDAPDTSDSTIVKQQPANIDKKVSPQHDALVDTPVSTAMSGATAELEKDISTVTTNEGAVKEKSAVTAEEDTPIKATDHESAFDKTEIIGDTQTLNLNPYYDASEAVYGTMSEAKDLAHSQAHIDLTKKLKDIDTNVAAGTYKKAHAKLAEDLQALETLRAALDAMLSAPATPALDEVMTGAPYVTKEPPVAEKPPYEPQLSTESGYITDTAIEDESEVDDSYVDSVVEPADQENVNPQAPAHEEVIIPVKHSYNSQPSKEDGYFSDSSDVEESDSEERVPAFNGNQQATLQDDDVDSDIFTAEELDEMLEEPLVTPRAKPAETQEAPSQTAITELDDDDISPAYTPEELEEMLATGPLSDDEAVKWAVKDLQGTPDWADEAMEALQEESKSNPSQEKPSPVPSKVNVAGKNRQPRTKVTKPMSSLEMIPEDAVLITKTDLMAVSERLHSASAFLKSLPSKLSPKVVAFVEQVRGELITASENFLANDILERTLRIEGLVSTIQDVLRAEKATRKTAKPRPEANRTPSKHAPATDSKKSVADQRVNPSKKPETVRPAQRTNAKKEAVVPPASAIAKPSARKKVETKRTKPVSSTPGMHKQSDEKMVLEQLKRELNSTNKKPGKLIKALSTIKEKARKQLTIIANKLKSSPNKEAKELAISQQQKLTTLLGRIGASEKKPEALTREGSELNKKHAEIRPSDKPDIAQFYKALAALQEKLIEEESKNSATTFEKQFKAIMALRKVSKKQ